MTRFLEEFENNLEKEVSVKYKEMWKKCLTQVSNSFSSLCFFKKMCGHLRLLNIACAAKAKPRLVTLTKPSRDSPLAFSLLGGQEKGFRIFIDAVEPGSKAAEAGLKRGDQVSWFFHHYYCKEISVILFTFFPLFPLLTSFLTPTSCTLDFEQNISW